MRFFVDTADVDQIRKANDMGVICGVTTNPSLIAKSGRQFEDVIKEITSIVDGAISGEVKATTTDAEGMIKEGREIAKIMGLAEQTVYTKRNRLRNKLKNLLKIE
jgi:transaldolase